jgi:hypothetical protein
MMEAYQTPTARPANGPSLHSAGARRDPQALYTNSLIFLAVLVIVLKSNKKNRLFDPPFLAPICPRSECNYSFAGAATVGAATGGAAAGGAGGFW